MLSIVETKIELTEESTIEQDTNAPLSLREATSSFKERIDKLLHEKSGEQASSEDRNKTISLFKLIQEEIQSHLTYLNTLESDQFNR